jgi:hypothetical protein
MALAVEGVNHCTNSQTDDKIDSSNYRCLSILSTSSLYSILSRLIPFVDGIIGDHQCAYRCNRSATDHTNNKSTVRLDSSYFQTSRKSMMQFRAQYYTVSAMGLVHPPNESI